MKTGYVATSTIAYATRTSLLRMQAELVNAQKELVSGKVADPGLALGARAGKLVSIDQERSSLQTMIDANTIVASRLQATQAALGGIADQASSFLGALVGVGQADGAASALRSEADAALRAITGALNTAFGGTHLFGGINIDVPPMGDFFSDPPSAGRQEIDAAFMAAFGIAPDDAAAGAIDGPSMQAFLDGEFAALFEEGAWASDWSAASDRNIRSRISRTELIETSVSANEAPFRQIVMALAMVGSLASDELNGAARQAIVDSATALVGKAVGGITAMQTRLGAAEARVDGATETMTVQSDLLQKYMSALDGVDPLEAAARVNGLTTQIETAYALTARLQQLSLLNFL